MTYDLRSVALPRLGTTALRLFTALLENPLTRAPLLAKLRRDGGLNRLRAIALDEPPTPFPVHPGGARNLPPIDPSPYLVAPRGFSFPGIDDYGAAYREKRTSPERVAERFLEQWKRSDGADGSRALRAFIAVRADDLAAQAKASGERWAAGRPIGAFDGVPVAIKDELDVAGYPTTVGTRILGRAPATLDATVVARLRSAGALIVGKANMHEVGINVTGLNPHHGTTRNPYDDGAHTGGSSSGPATAVAAGLVPVAIGADGGGSIRIPSAFCSLVGIKATFGRISEFGAAPLAWSVAHIGPLAGSVRDCAQTYLLIAGADARDAQTQGHPPVELDAATPGSLDGIRLGVYWPWFRHATAPVAGRCEALLQELVAHGATLVEVDVPELDAQRVAHIASILGDMASAMAAYYPSRRGDFSLDARCNLAVARTFTGAECVSAARFRTRAMSIWRQAFAKVDAIVTPATGCVAPRINEAAQPLGESDLSVTTEIMRFAFPPNFTGHPAISFPAGYDSSGLPIGVQVIGRPWEERLLFRIAALAETLVERRRPKRFYPLLDA